MTTAILADDETLVRELLRSRLQQCWPDLIIVGEASDGQEAIDLVAEHSPDIAFLDIRMPERTGLQVAKIISARCHVVFLTAFDEYAIEAFERGAADYLLKPVTAERLSLTVERLKQRLQQKPIDLSELVAKIEANQEKPAKLKWIQASVGRELRMIAIDDVVYFKADEKYVVVRTRDTEAVIRTPLKELTEGLDDELFWAVHRAVIVNVRMIEAIEKDVLGRLAIRLKGLTEKLPVSRAHAPRFKGM
jgi:DNA-binding LytR/AlgR family response regulator